MTDEGRLAAIQPGSLLDFETRLSDGQRRRLAIRIAASRFPGQAVVLNGEHWSHLDEDARREVHRIAAEEGAYIVTEHADAGPLRVEHFGDAA